MLNSVWSSFVYGFLFALPFPDLHRRSPPVIFSVHRDDGFVPWDKVTAALNLPHQHVTQKKLRMFGTPTFMRACLQDELSA
jgi:hypothetical protein